MSAPTRLVFWLVAAAVIATRCAGTGATLRSVAKGKDLDRSNGWRAVAILAEIGQVLLVERIWRI